MAPPPTCPDSTDPRAMAMVRNRAMMPVIMSVVTEIAVPTLTLATVQTAIGHRCVHAGGLVAGT